MYFGSYSLRTLHRLAPNGLEDYSVPLPQIRSIGTCHPCESDVMLGSSSADVTLCKEWLMTKAEMQGILKRLGWTQVVLAREVGVHPTSIYRWKVVPRPVAAYLELAIRIRELLPKG